MAGGLARGLVQDADPTLDRKPGVPPAQEGLGELLRDEAELQEQADGALMQQLGEASGVVDGKEVVLAIRVESALEEQGMEVRIKPECATKGLIREDGRAGDGLAGSGGVELGDQRENEAGNPAEESLVVTEEYSKSFGDG
jgi:hypothetical protein